MEKKLRYTFPREEKLKSRKLIELLFKEGKTFSHFPFRITWMFHEKSGYPLQVGFTAGTRNFKKAVDRNRIKRLMREAYRLQKSELLEYLMTNNRQMAIFFIYLGNEIPEYDLVCDKIAHVIRRLKKIIDENPSAHP